MRRYASEYDLSNKELERLKRDFSGKLDDLKRLQSDNLKIQGNGYEDKIELLEA